MFFKNFLLINMKVKPHNIHTIADLLHLKFGTDLSRDLDLVCDLLRDLVYLECLV